jgi:hypothetical protein
LNDDEEENINSRREENDEVELKVDVRQPSPSAESWICKPFQSLPAFSFPRRQILIEVRQSGRNPWKQHMSLLKA